MAVHGFFPTRPGRAATVARMLRSHLALLFPLAALAAPVTAQAAPSQASVVATAETVSRYGDDAGGSADSDDPAIWVNPIFRSQSFVVGALKEGGLTAFDLSGRTLQDLPAPPAPREDDARGRLNNVDVLYGARIGRRTVDLAVASDRGRDQVRSYAIDPIRATFGRAPLRDVTSPETPLVFNEDQDAVNDQETVYGLTAWVDRRSRVPYVVVSQRHATRLALLRLVGAADGIRSETVDTIDLPSSFPLPSGGSWTPCDEPGVGPQVEGMVVDAERGLLFAAQEDVGLWRLKVGTDGFGADPVLFDRTREFGTPATYGPETEECTTTGAAPAGAAGEHLSADAEGLTIYRGQRGSGYLLASSQGDSTFAVYGNRGLGSYVGGFTVGDGPATDAVQHSDGAAVVNVNLGPRFPRGLFVTQDGDDQPGDTEREPTNFKLVPWDRIAQPLGLRIDPFGFSPRFGG